MMDPENVMYSFFDKTLLNFLHLCDYKFQCVFGLPLQGYYFNSNTQANRQTAVNGVSLSTTHISPTIR